MSEIYSTAVVTDDRGRRHRLDPDLAQILAKSRDYDKLKWAWQGWRNATGPSIKPLYARLVAGMNQAAIDNGNHGNHACKRYQRHCRYDDRHAVVGGQINAPPPGISYRYRLNNCTIWNVGKQEILKQKNLNSLWGVAR